MTFWRPSMVISPDKPRNNATVVNGLDKGNKTASPTLSVRIVVTPSET